MTKTVRMAVAWLRKEDCPRWQAIDPELPPYERWLGGISRSMIEAGRRGISAEKVMVDPDAYAAWCKAEGKPIHRDARAAYAAVQLRLRMGAHRGRMAHIWHMIRSPALILLMKMPVVFASHNLKAAGSNPAPATNSVINR